MKPAMIQKVLLAKTKLRDIAAGQMSVADANHHSAQLCTEARRGEMESLFRHMQTKPPTSGSDLLLFDEERQMAKKHVERAIQSQNLAQKECEKQRKILLEKSRALKTIEKVYETFQQERATAQQKQEQLQNDEFASRPLL